MKPFLRILANVLIPLHLMVWLLASSLLLRSQPPKAPPLLRETPSPSRTLDLSRPEGATRSDSFFWERGPMRGIWLDRGRLPRGREEAVRLFERLRAMGITDVFAETYARGSAVSYLSAQTVNDPRIRVSSGWLPMFLEAARARKVKVHAWTWMLCCATGGQTSPLMAVHPEWLARTAEGETVSEWNSWWLCPSSEDVHAHLEGVVRELVERFPFEGINLDYMRVDGDGDRHYCYCARCRETFHRDRPERAGEPWPPHRYDPDFRRWRWGCIDRLVARLARAIRGTRPGTRVSCCVLPRPSFARRMCGQNWLGWLERGDLDFACALTYDPRPERLLRFAKIYEPYLARHFAIYPGVALHKTDGAGAIALMDCLDDTSFEGYCLFSYRQLRSPVEAWLRNRWQSSDLAGQLRLEAHSQEG